MQTFGMYCAEIHNLTSSTSYFPIVRSQSYQSTKHQIYEKDVYGNRNFSEISDI